MPEGIFPSLGGKIWENTIGQSNMIKDEIDKGRLQLITGWKN